MEQVRQNVDEHCVIALLANKFDLLSDKSIKREVSEEQIKEFAEINSLIYLGECSALADINIKPTID